MGIAILVSFGVIIIFVMAFKNNKSETTVSRQDEDGKTVTEHHETVHHTAGQTAARVVVGIILTFILLVLFFLCSQ